MIPRDFAYHILTRLINYLGGHINDWIGFNANTTRLYLVIFKKFTIILENPPNFHKWVANYCAWDYKGVHKNFSHIWYGFKSMASFYGNFLFDKCSFFFFLFR